jgi:ankyrin repeat protein
MTCVPYTGWPRAGGYAHTARILLDAGASVDLVDRDGWHALVMAARSSPTDTAAAETVRVLLEGGATADLQTEDGTHIRLGCRRKLTPAILPPGYS